MLAQLFLLFLCTVAANAQVTLCDAGDLDCTRETLADLLGYKAIQGNGSDTFYDTLPIRVDVPVTNGTVRIYEAEYQGFSNATIQSFIQDSNYTFLTVFFPAITFPVYNFSVTVYSINTPPQTVFSFGNFTFPSVTSTVFFPGTEAPLSLSTAKVFTTLQDYSAATIGFEDLTAQIEALDNALFTSTLAAVADNIDAVLLEALDSLGVRAASAYTATNLAYVLQSEIDQGFLSQA